MGKSDEDLKDRSGGWMRWLDWTMLLALGFARVPIFVVGVENDVHNIRCSCGHWVCVGSLSLLSGFGFALSAFGAIALFYFFFSGWMPGIF